MSELAAPPIARPAASPAVDEREIGADAVVDEPADREAFP